MIDFMIGASIDDAADRMACAALDYTTRVEAVFNGVRLEAKCGTSPRRIRQQYWEALSKRESESESAKERFRMACSLLMNDIMRRKELALKNAGGQISPIELDWLDAYEATKGRR